MDKIEETIRELCPNGVVYKKIKEAFIRLKGTPITAGKMKEIENPDGEIRIFAGGKTVINAKEEDIPNANITRVPAVLVQSRGVIDFIYYDKPFTFKNEMWAYTAEDATTVKFLYYVLKNNVEHFRESASGMGALPQISLGVTEDYEVPLPPLAAQREIVRVLDKFTLLSQELAAELAARRAQYEYYRDKLLNFTNNGGGTTKVN
ncbi:MAG: restriction endonuclease subunit S [Candidatus Coproplasma sp.]